MKIAMGLIAGVLFLGLLYWEHAEEEDGTLGVEYTQGPEALSWLRKSHNESALASNRFLQTSNAIRFVQQLYSAGAVKVIVPLPSIDRDGDETYADALVVTLPAEKSARDRVWKLCREELRREGAKPPAEAPDQTLLWWD